MLLDRLRPATLTEDIRVLLVISVMVEACADGETSGSDFLSEEKVFCLMRVIFLRL